MLKARFVPLQLSEFPNPRHATDRVMRCPFKSTYLKTLNLLDYELDKLFATDVSIRAGFSHAQLRNDGWPLSAAKPSHPAVILEFEGASTGKVYTFPCDMFAVYQVNLHAIAYTLKALRDVERYGVARGGQQFSGFLQIEGVRKMTVEDAAFFIGAFVGVPTNEIVVSQTAYNLSRRRAAIFVHPDVHPERADDWAKFQEACTILDRHHKIGVKQANR